jgi:tetratricopeptide (TPR) repeat protein
MSASAARVLIAAACLIWLSGCETSTKLTGLFGSKGGDPQTTASIPNPDPSADPTTTGGINGPPGPPVVTPGGPIDASAANVLGRDPNDDLSLGKKYFRAANFGTAEKHFRKAVELHPRDVEAWVGLAASYDRLRRFELADRAYSQAARIAGDTPEIMNNRGFSYLLRGDYARARRTLEAAQARAPDNPYIRNNLQLLEKTQRRGRSVN